MAIYWTAQRLAGELEPLEQYSQATIQQMSAWLAAAGYVVAGAIAYWYGATNPQSNVPPQFQWGGWCDDAGDHRTGKAI